VAALGQDMRCAVVSGQDWSDVRALAARATTLTPWVSGGDRYAITFRPLLPDEAGCPSIP
jgi:hypothetical protein